MNNATIVLKVSQRLNKLSSNDYANIQPWQIIEAFNKGQVDWIRRNGRGTNLYKEGAEQSIRRIDDLQKILKDSPNLTVTDKGIYFETNVTAWPADYCQFSRINCLVTSDCCPTPKLMEVWLGEEANVNEYMKDRFRRPNYEWGETFGIMKGNKLLVYHDNKFDIDTLNLVYYRQPVKIEIAGVKDPYTGLVPTVDVECEFKDDLCEVLIGEAVKIIAGDTENSFQYQRNKSETEENN